MSFYDDFTPYRNDALCTPSQQAIEQAQRRRPQGPVNGEARLVNGTVVMNDPVLQLYVDNAYFTAENDLAPRKALPLSPTTAERYPGTDPMGKFCDVDMDFAHRLRHLEHASQLCTGENKKQVEDFLSMLKEGKAGEELRNLRQNVAVDCSRIRLTEHAARLCPDPDASKALEKGAQEIARTSQDIQEFNAYLTLMEQVAGLKQGPMDAAAMQDYNDLTRVHLGRVAVRKDPTDMSSPVVRVDQYTPDRLTANLPVGTAVQRNIPEALNLEFQNFDNVVEQSFFSDPANWYNRITFDGPEKFVDMNKCMLNYAQGCADAALSTLYGSTELAGEGMDRGNLVIVDGKTVRERMQEEYLKKTPDGSNFDKYYQDHYRADSNRIIAAALVAGKQVEAFVPDANGKLPDQPVQITKTGYAPSAMRPVTLNAWERFFNRFGFFKEKAAKADEYNRMMDARERVKAQQTARENEKLMPGERRSINMFFGEYLKGQGLSSMAELNARQANSSGYRIGRSAAPSACICILAAQGYSLQDILDPTKLQNERQDATRLYMEHANLNPNTHAPATAKEGRIGDAQWLGSVYFHGQQAIMRQINSTMKNVDLTNAQQRSAVLPTLMAASKVVFDGFQECDKFPEVNTGYFRAAHQTALNTNSWLTGDALASQTQAESCNLSYFCTALREADTSRAELGSPISTNNPKFHLIRFAQEKFYLESVAQNPERPFIQRIPQEYTAKSLQAHLFSDQNFQKLGDALEETKDWQKLGRIAGQITDGIEVTAETEAIVTHDPSHELRWNQDGSAQIATVRGNHTVTQVTGVGFTVKPTLGKALGMQPAAPQAQPQAPRR